MKTKAKVDVVRRWCERCQEKTWQTIRDLGSWEIHRCHACGTERRYKVRW